MNAKSLSFKMKIALFKYLESIRLPNIKIDARGEMTDSFLRMGILCLWDAINVVKNLPYGRTTDRSNYRQVLEEKKGACSTKHALIASLAHELSIPLTLVLGVFFLDESQVPAIGPLLNFYQLKVIPEAHCYLKYEDHSLDITFPHSLKFTFSFNLEKEMEIHPLEIGEFKIAQHQLFIKEWLENDPDLNFDTIWQAREEWIKKLTDNKEKI